MVNRMDNTDKKRTGSSPLLLHLSSLLSSLTLVRNATLPSLEQASHVPPSTASLPPNISLWSSHHCNGVVPLNIQPPPIKSKSKELKKQREKELNVVPVEVLVSVEEEEKRVAWMRLPHERSYTHVFFLSGFLMRVLLLLV